MKKCNWEVHVEFRRVGWGTNETAHALVSASGLREAARLATERYWGSGKKQFVDVTDVFKSDIDLYIVEKD